MSLQEKYRLEYVGNRAEEMVYRAIEELIESGASMCTCESCVQDLAAWTLNHVEPEYYTTLIPPLQHDLYQRRRERLRLEAALASGLKRLREHPHHD